MPSIKLNNKTLATADNSAITWGADVPAKTFVNFEKYTSTTQVSSNSTTYVEAISGAFTPKYDDSLIMIQFNSYNGGSTNNAVVYQIKLLRDSYTVSECRVKYIGVNAPDDNSEYTHKIFYDTPNTTSEIIYKIEIRRAVYAGSYGGTFYMQRDNQEGSLTIMEIKQ